MKKILVSILGLILVGGIIFISTNSNKVTDKDNIDNQEHISNNIDKNSNPDITSKFFVW